MDAPCPYPCTRFDTFADKPPTGAIVLAFPEPQRKAPALTNVSSAGFEPAALAPGALVSAFGPDLALSSSQATELPLPVELAGTSVTVIDSKGAEHRAALLFVSQTQVNYLMPETVAVGMGLVRVTNSRGTRTEGPIEIAAVSPGLFTVNGDGLLAATTLTVVGSQQTADNVFVLNDLTGGILPKAIDVRAGDVYLIAYGTGFRGANAADAKLQIDDVMVPALYVGPQGAFAGLDQVNALLPPTLARRSAVPVVLIVNGRRSNVGTLTFR